MSLRRGIQAAVLPKRFERVLIIKECQRRLCCSDNKSTLTRLEGATVDTSHATRVVGETIQSTHQHDIQSTSTKVSPTASSSLVSPWDSNRHLNASPLEVAQGLSPNLAMLPSGIPSMPSSAESGSPLALYTDGSKWDELKKVQLQRHGCVLVWIQPGNTRVKDNYPLALGAQKAKLLGVPLVTLYVVDGRTFAQPSSVAGFFRKSPQRATFALECVHALRAELEGKHDTPLLVRTGFPEFIVPDLCRALRARYCFTSSQYAPHENLIESSIRKQLASRAGEFVISREAAEHEEELVRLKQSPEEGGPPHLADAATPTGREDGEQEGGVAVRCVFQPVWDSTMIHYDDVITPVETMREGIRWYLEDLPLSQIRPTGPYDCDDGRLERITQQIRERLGTEFSFALTRRKKRSSAGNSTKEAEAEALKMEVYGVEHLEELGSFEMKHARRKPQKRVSSAVGGYHLGGDYEDTLPAPASSLPWCLLPTAEEKGVYSSHLAIAVNAERRSGAPSTPNPIRGKIPTLDELGYGGWRTEIFRPDNSVPATSCDWVGGEAAAWVKLREWVEEFEGLKTYARYEDIITTKVRMTEMYKDHCSSKISPYIASGCLSPRSMMYYLRGWLEKNRAQSGMAARWYNEAMVRLGRRDFAHFMGLRYGRSLFFPYGPRPEQTNDIPDWRCDEKIIRRWCAGLTGVPFCDAAMKELTNTGWVAHEGRQALAWLATRGYGQDWRVVAEWFERCSLDYDPFLTYWWTATSAELIRDDFGENVYSANFIAHHADQSGIYVKKWFPSMFKIPPTYIHRVHVMTPRMQEMHNVRIGKDYPYPIKLWDGASTEEHGKLTGTQLKAYFATPEECNGNGWFEAHRFGTMLVPPQKLPIITGDTVAAEKKLIASDGDGPEAQQGSSLSRPSLQHV